MTASLKILSNLDLVKNCIGGGDLNVGGLLLNKDVLHDTVVHDDHVALAPLVAEQTFCIEKHANLGSEGGSVVGEEVDVRGGSVQLLLPGLSDKGIVDGNDVDVLDTLGLECLVLFDVAGNVVRARAETGTLCQMMI
jgi:hypothetical protein